MLGRAAADGVRLREQPAADARPGELSWCLPWARAHRLAARGGGASTTDRRGARSTRAASCSSALERGSRNGRLRPALRPRGRVPRVPAGAPARRPRRSTRMRAAWPGEAACRDDDPPRLQPADRRPRSTSRRRAAARSCKAHLPTGLGLPLTLARGRARPKPGRGGVRCRPTRSPRPTAMVLVPERREVRRCAAPATTRASCAGTPFANGMASGWHLHHSRWSMRDDRHGTPSRRDAAVAADPAARRTRAHTLSSRRRRSGSPGCSRTRPRHGRVLRADGQRLRALPARTRWHRPVGRCGAATTAARCCA